MRDQKEYRFIVDRDITDNAIQGIFLTIQDAIDHAHQKIIMKNQFKKHNIKVKIASNMYEEALYINVPGIILEPKEKGGEVTLQQKHQPCIIVDVGVGNTVTILNTRMLLKGTDAGSSRVVRVADEASNVSRNRVTDNSIGESASNFSISQNNHRNFPGASINDRINTHPCMMNFS